MGFVVVALEWTESQSVFFCFLLSFVSSTSSFSCHLVHFALFLLPIVFASPFAHSFFPFFTAVFTLTVAVSTSVFVMLAKGRCGSLASMETKRFCFQVMTVGWGIPDKLTYSFCFVYSLYVHILKWYPTWRGGGSFFCVCVRDARRAVLAMDEALEWSQGDGRRRKRSEWFPGGENSAYEVGLLDLGGSLFSFPPSLGFLYLLSRKEKKTVVLKVGYVG